uniref:CRAL-TRIO domain-containing protein n=1 Tax=Glossina austeni TaxID=7395 RepID=A0A1A9VSE1_GLOAU
MNSSLISYQIYGQHNRAKRPKNYIACDSQKKSSTDRLLLKRFYQCMYENVEDAQKLIEINYLIRNSYPHIFLKRDPNDASSRQTFEYADMVPLPGLTKEKYKITFFRLNDPDPKKMNHTEDTKGYIMVTDCRFCSPDLLNDDSLSEGEVQIFDMTGFSLKHAARFSMSSLRIYMKFLHQAFPVRIKCIHMINCPPYLDRLISVVRPFISKEVFKLIYFHTASIDTLYEHVPRELLPDEYGGSAGKLSDLKAQFMQVMSDKRDYLMDPNYWKVESS